VANQLNSILPGLPRLRGGVGPPALYTRGVGPPALTNADKLAMTLSV